MKDSTFYEYLAIITPSTSVFWDTLDMKYQCKLEYGWNTSVKSLPHITLSNFVQPQYIEEKIVNRYNKLAASISPFDIHLSGFGHFIGTTYTIYVNIQNGNQISEIAKHAKELSKPILKRIKEYKPYYTNNPHLTIAKGIPETDFNKAWPAWQIKNYNAFSNAAGIQLLKREKKHFLNKYEDAGFFPFNGLGPLDEQLKLF